MLPNKNITGISKKLVTKVYIKPDLKAAEKKGAHANVANTTANVDDVRVSSTAYRVTLPIYMSVVAEVEYTA
jgi:hypothetical protein